MRTQECRKHIRKTGVLCNLKEATINYVENIMDFAEIYPEISPLSTDAVEALKTISDPVVQEKAISSVSKSLESGKNPLTGRFKKKGERLTKPEIERVIKKHLPPEEKKKESDGGKSSVSTEPVKEPEPKRPTSPSQPAEGSIIVTDDPPIKSMGELSREKDVPEETPVEPAVAVIPAVRKAPCLSGDDCPDGKRHLNFAEGKGKDIKAAKCGYWGQFVTQMVGDECPLDVKARREAKKAELGFTTAGQVQVQTQERPKVTKYPLLSGKQIHEATTRFMEDCLMDKYHRVIRDARNDHGFGTDIDAICKALDLLNEWEGDRE